MKLVLLALGLVGLLSGQAAPPDDEALWKHFESWVSRLEPLAPGERRPLAERYVDALVASGVAKDDASKRFDRILRIRRGSSAREMVYWNGSFKSGGGPDAPLQLLQETVRQLKPGRVLDAGMGRGRNAIFLASLGWDVTGYDIAADALAVAQTDASRAGVKLRTVEASHDTFPFGTEQWDLIVCAYCYIDVRATQWPGTFLKALKPGGVVVFQSSLGERISVADVAAMWKDFHVLRVEDLDAGMVDNDWGPSRTNPTVRLVARKRQ